MTRPTLRVINSGMQSLVLDRSSGLLGSSPDVDYVLPHPTVSRCHAQIQLDGDRIRIEDLGSTNGVKVNGRPVRSSTVEEGDVVTLGAVRLRFSRTADADVAAPRERVVPWLELAAAIVAALLALTLWSRKGRATGMAVPPAAPAAVGAASAPTYHRTASVQVAPSAADPR